jgi:CheY-like chemotaxis protein
MPLPIYQHPSLAVLVDDSPSFLRSLAFQLEPTLPRKAFHDAYAAIDWIRQQSFDAARPEGLLSGSVDTYPRSSQQCAVALDIDQIHQISLRPRRFMTPSVLVVDYSMPQMNGVEFCEALSDLPCRKILLTGTADENVAVAAFNRGLIHRYIRKSDDDALDQLGTEILALQQDYFTAQSDSMRGFLALHDYRFVIDPTVGRLVGEVCKRYQIVEHYLFPNPAGVLLFDSDGKARLLILETEHSMDSHYEVALDNNAPLSLLAALEKRRVIPHFGDGDGMYSPAFGENWHQYTQPAQVCHGTELYYWAVFEMAPGALPNGVISFRSFMREHLSPTFQ